MEWINGSCSQFTEITTPIMGVDLYKLLRLLRRQFLGNIWGKNGEKLSTII